MVLQYSLKPHVIVYLDAPVDVVQAKIRERYCKCWIKSVSWEYSCDKEYLENILMLLVTNCSLAK